MEYPITPAIRYLRDNKVAFEPRLYDYVEKGGTRVSSEALGVSEHVVIKTLVFETNEQKPLIVLMHGDRQVSAKNLARYLNVKAVNPMDPEKASKLTGYLVGGTSPFGTRTKMPVYAEKTIFELPEIYINGGKRGFLVALGPAELRRVLEVKEVEVGLAETRQ